MVALAILSHFSLPTTALLDVEDIVAPLLLTLTLSATTLAVAVVIDDALAVILPTPDQLDVDDTTAPDSLTLLPFAFEVAVVVELAVTSSGSASITGKPLAVTVAVAVIVSGVPFAVNLPLQDTVAVDEGFASTSRTLVA